MKSKMSRRAEGQLFVGRLSKSTRTRDLEDLFEPYGRLNRCEIKYGAEMAYAFVDYEDRRDAEDALKYENGRELVGSSIIVEWAKGNPRRPVSASRSSSTRSKGYDECYKCRRVGHWARDCPDDRYYGYRRPSRSGGRRSPARHRSSSRDHKKSKRSRSRSRSPRRRSRRERTASRSQSASRSRSRSPPTHNNGDHQRSRSNSPEQSGGSGEDD